MSNNIRISTSYVQDQKHSRVSDRFNVVQASQVGQVMANHGLDIVSLSTGRARHADKADFQRTYSRYRGPEIARDGDKPVFLDVIYDSKHMGRGVDKILLGIYRMICTNGLFAGMNFFSHAIRHSGATYDSLNEGIRAALSMQDKLAETIRNMQGVILTPVQREELALEAIKLLTPSTATQVRHALLRPNRESDSSMDLWTTYNLVQENSVKGRRVAYTLQSLDAFGRESSRQMTVRPIKPNTGKDASFNQALFDTALKLVA